MREPRNGAPMSQARTRNGTLVYPSSCSRRRTLGTQSFLAAPSTFSITVHCGWSSSTIRSSSHMSPDCAPASPAFVLDTLASLLSWQGGPPHRISTGSSCVAPTSRTSLYLLVSGQCFSNTFLHHSSFSTCQRTGLSPACSRPSSRPPIPLNSEPIVMLFL